MQRNNNMIYLVTALFAFGRSFSGANYPSYVEVLGGTIVNYGFIQSVETFFSFICLIPAAFLADKIGHKRLVIASAIMSTLAYLIIVFAPDWQYLILGGVSVGLGRGMLMPSQVAILANSNPPKKRVRIFTANEIARWSSLASGYFLSSFFFIQFQNELSYRNLQLTLIITFLVIALAIIPSILLIGNKKVLQLNDGNSKVQEPNMNIHEIINSPQGKFILGFLLMSLVIGAGAGFLVPFTQPYFLRFLLKPSEINLIMGITQIITAVFMGSIPFLSTKLSSVRVIYLTQGLSIPLILILAYSTLLPLSIFAYVFRIVLMNMSSPAQTTVLQQYVPKKSRATVQSLMRATDQIGRSFSPTISAIMISETDGFSISFTTTALFYSVAVLILYSLTRSLRGKLDFSYI
ncbi:MAG: MFS transporter [Candidatus Hodarchaeota archaeon]